MELEKLDATLKDYLLMFWVWSAGILLAYLAFGCCGPKPVVYHPPIDQDQCAPACERMKSLGCEEGGDIEGLTCTEWCVATLDVGHGLNPTCIVQINACGEIEKCGE